MSNDPGRLNGNMSFQPRLSVRVFQNGGTEPQSVLTKMERLLEEENVLRR